MSIEMPDPASSPSGSAGVVPVTASLPASWFRRGRTNPWLVFLLPFVVYMLVGCLEPAAPVDGVKSTSWLDLGIEYRHYPLVYSLKILLTMAAMVYVFPGYRQIPCRIASGPELDRASGRPAGSRLTGEGRREGDEQQKTPLNPYQSPYTSSLPLPSHLRGPFLLAIVVGIVGAAVWIGLAIAQRDVQERFGWSLGLDARSAFNPLDEKLITSREWAYGFLAIRFVGLALIVPVIEEFFLRGFVMRFVMAADWWKIPIGTASLLAIVAGTVIPLLTHPFSEAVAVAVWFSTITWLLLRTRNIWSCVAAHAITNLLLGVYVVASGDWWLM